MSEIMESSAAPEMSTESAEIETDGAEIPEEQELTPSEKKKLSSLKYKFNGKEYEEKLPFEIDEDHAEYMRKQIQMAKLAQSKSQESANLEREVVSFLQELKTNPRKALANPMIGIDVKQLAAEILEEEIENSKKSPEQREKEELQAKLKAIEEERQREKEEAQKREYEAVLERTYEKYDTMLSTALDKNPDLPQNPYILEKMTKYMSVMVDGGYEPDMDIITNMVRDELEKDVKHLLTVLPVEKVEAILGQDVLGKLRKNRLANSKKPTTIPTKKVAVDVAAMKKQEPKKESKPQTIRDFFKV